jgi:ATP synthase protein I
MRDNFQPDSPEPGAFRRAIHSKTIRKLKAQRRGGGSLWFGLGMSGLIGWSVAIPTLLGALGGRWIDKHFPSTHSWTLALLVAGLVVGCAQAWHWCSQEDRKIRKEEQNNDE